LPATGWAARSDAAPEWMGPEPAGSDRLGSVGMGMLGRSAAADGG
jgi:hypothetical protein